MRNKEDEDLFLPIYIDTKKLIDLNSVLFDGFSEFHETTFEYTNNQQAKAKAGLDIKILKIGTGAEVQEGSHEKTTSTTNHTPSSLLLQTLKSLKKFTSFNKIKIGSFVEINGVFKNNSLIDFMEQMLELMQFADKASKLAPKKADGKPQTDFKTIIKLINDMKSAFESNNLDFREFVYEDKDYIYVIQLSKEFLNKTTLNDIHEHNLMYLGQIKNIVDDYKFFSETPIAKISPELSLSLIDSLKPIVNDPNTKFNFELKSSSNGKKTIVLDLIAIYRK